MTVSSSTASASYTGNGTTTAFTVPFYFLVDTDVKVSQKVAATGVISVLTLNSDYTLTGAGNQAGGSATFVTAPATGDTVFIERNVDAVQETAYPANGIFPASSHEKALDRLTMLVQQILSRLTFGLFRDPLASTYDVGGNTLSNAADAIDAQDVPSLAQVQTLVTSASTGIVPSLIVKFTDLAASIGSTLVGFIQSGTGAVARTLQAKGRDVVHADDFGLVGNGSTDETTKLQQMFNAAQGKVLHLGYGKTYALASATGLTIPDNTTLVSNGSVFKRLQANTGTPTDASYNITVGSNCSIDRIELSIIGGPGDIGAVQVLGSNVDIGTIKITSPVAGSVANGIAWVGARIGPNTGTATNVRIGSLVSVNLDRPFVIQNLASWSVGFIDVNTYLRGVYIRDCVSGIVRGGWIRGQSPYATGKAGENGILVSGENGHNTLRSLRMENITVEDSGEHGFRLGAAYTMRDVWHVSCHVKNSGSAIGTGVAPDNNGGCGFKTLGPTSLFGSRHQNIHYIDCSVESINNTAITTSATAGGLVNFSGFQLGKVYGGSIVNPVVRSAYPDSGSENATGYSCQNGIELIGCDGIRITNPNIIRPYRSGIYIYDALETGGLYWGSTNSITINGGLVSLPVEAGVEIVFGYSTARNLNVVGATHIIGGKYAIKTTKTGAGAIIGAWADVTSNSQSTESFNGCDDWQIQGRGNFIGTNACKNGSIYQDLTNGTLKYRKAAAWTAL